MKYNYKTEKSYLTREEEIDAMEELIEMVKVNRRMYSRWGSAFKKEIGIGESYNNKGAGI